MPKTAQMVSNIAHQVPRKDQCTESGSLSLVSSQKSGGDFESLFEMLDKLGPAPNDFMIGLSDPMLETENIFELELD